MKITSRLTHNFIELKVDEIETTAFKSTNEPQEIIDNLLSIVDDLCLLTGQHFYYELKEQE